MTSIIKGIKGLWFFFWGHVFALFFYDQKYLKGKWFRGKLHGLCSLGWKWVYYSALSRLFSGNNTDARFPVGQGCKVMCPQNIDFDPDDLNNFQGYGKYFQACGKITIGKGTYIAPNVGLITANHDVNNLDKNTIAKQIKIGNKCWIGMNAMILPGVKLGDHTVVGAGSVVTKSFPDGYVVIAGNPAKIIKRIENLNDN